MPGSLHDEGEEALGSGSDLTEDGLAFRTLLIDGCSDYICTPCDDVYAEVIG